MAQKALRRPRTPNELWEWCRDVLEFQIAREVTTEGHRSPFSFLADAYFEKQNMLLARGCRGAGKTQLFAIHHLAQTVFKDGIYIVHVGGTEQQARYGYAYYAGESSKEGVTGLIRRSPFSGLLASEPMVSKTTLKSGSKVEIRTGGSEKSVSGPHPHILAVDELDHIAWPTLNTALQMPMTHGKYSSATMMASSQYHSYGTMQALISGAERRGIKVYEFDIFDVMASCEHTYPRDCGDCPLYRWTNPYTNEEEELCKGRGSRGPGHYSYNDVVAKFLGTDTETFALQNLLMRGTSQGMVYPQFSKGRHASRSFPPEGSDISRWVAFAGIDLRSRGRIVVMAQAPERVGSKPLRWVIDAWSDDQATPSKIRNAAREVRERVKQTWGLHVDVFWAEPTASDEMADWQQEGLNGRCIPTEVRQVSYGIGLIRDAFRDAVGNTSLYIDPSCEDLIIALADLYHCKRTRDGEYNRDVPDDEGSDYPDALRYAYVGGPWGARRLPEHEALSEFWEKPYGKWNPY